MSAREAASAMLSGISSAYSVYDAGEYPHRSAYREAGRFFCAIESKHGGLLYVGQADDEEAAVRRAVEIAKGNWS